MDQENWNYIWYSNLDELYAKDKESAEQLLHNLGLTLDDANNQTDWAINSICVYQSVEDYIICELNEGWFADEARALLNMGSGVNPLDFVDFYKFGKAFINSEYAKGSRMLLPNDKVVVTWRFK